jgi:hypothetical protein
MWFPVPSSEIHTAEYWRISTFQDAKLHLWMRGSRRCEEMFKDHEGRILHRSRTFEDGDTFLRDVGNDLQSDEASLPRKNGVLLTSEFSREVSSSARQVKVCMNHQLFLPPSSQLYLFKNAFTTSQTKHRTHYNHQIFNGS